MQDFNFCFSALITSTIEPILPSCLYMRMSVIDTGQVGLCGCYCRLVHTWCLSGSSFWSNSGSDPDLKLGCSWGHPYSGGSREESAPCPSPHLVRWPWHPLACACITPVSASNFTSPLSPVFLSLVRHLSLYLVLTMIIQEACLISDQ